MAMAEDKNLNFTSLPTRSALGALTTVALMVASCSDSNDDNPTSASASGGSGGSASGGSGAADAGGASSVSTSAGGTANTGGTGNTACAADQYTHSFDFGAIFEGWSISTFSTSSLIPMEPAGAGGAGGEGGDGAAGEGGESPLPAGSGTVMEIDTSEGAPGSLDGALKLTIPFDGPAQLLLLGTVFNTGLNFTDTMVTAQIKVDSGLIVGPSDTARANLVLKATDGFAYYAGPAVVLDPSAGWVTLTIDPDTPSSDASFNGYNACEVREIDIEIHTGESGNYQQAVVYVDAITVAPKDD
jgi:hypothetical protein